MPKIKIQKDEIVEFLVDYLDLENVEDRIGELRGIDWNPFDDDGDEYEGAWEEMVHNWELVSQAARSLVSVAERIVIGGISLSNQQKHEAVVGALDRAVNAPWYLEAFDGPAISMIVSMAVGWMNAVNWGIGQDEVESKIHLALEGGSLRREV